MKILSFGSVNIDYTYQVDEFVRAGETISARDVVSHSGGKGFNQSTALARSGADVYHAGCIGKDGEWLRDQLSSSGVKVDFLRTIPGQTGNAIIQVNQKGNNCILLYSGANGKMTPEFIDEVLASFSAGDILLVQNEINCLDYLTKQAVDKGLLLALNPSPMNEKITDEILSRSTWIILNEVEAGDIAGDTDEEACLTYLSQHYPKAKIVLTLGTEGVLYQDAEMKLSHNSYPVQAVDTTGAGDTFTGFFLGAVAKGCDTENALEIASKAAALSVTKAGAAESIPQWEQVETTDFDSDQ